MSTHVSHRDVWYVGHVQGVGFRAQVLGLARGYDVTGYVQNLADGRVYLYTQYEPADARRMVADLVVLEREESGTVAGLLGSTAAYYNASPVTRLFRWGYAALTRRERVILDELSVVC